MGNDRSENGSSFSNWVNDTVEAGQRLLDGIFDPDKKGETSKENKTADGKSTPSPVAKDSLEIFSVLDRSNNGELSLPEVEFELDQVREQQRLDNLYALSIISSGESYKRPERKYDLEELYIIETNFDQIAGPDAQMSPLELQNYRNEREALPPIFKGADYDNNLRLDKQEVESRANAPRLNDDFAAYNTLLHVNRNFNTVAGRDGAITAAEYSQFLANSPPVE